MNEIKIKMAIKNLAGVPRALLGILLLLYFVCGNNRASPCHFLVFSPSIVEHVKKKMSLKCDVEESKNNARQYESKTKGVHFLGRDGSFCRERTKTTCLATDVMTHLLLAALRIC